MLLESRLSDGTQLFIDCETSGGFDKSDAASNFHPDDAVKNVCRVVGLVAAELSEAARTAASTKPAPSGIELDFTVKVDSKAAVSVGRNPEDGQFKIRVKWGR